MAGSPDPYEGKAAKREEMRRLAELKRRREQGEAAPAPADAHAATRPAGPDPLEGRRAKAEEAKLLKERRLRELAAAAKDPRGASRWKDRAEAQMLTVEEKLRQMFGEPAAARDKERRRRK